MAPTDTGSGAEMLQSSITEFLFPNGTYWSKEENK